MKISRAILEILFWMAVASIPFFLWPLKTQGSEPWITLSTALLWTIVYWKILSLLWKFVIQIGSGRKKKSKRGKGYRSPEEFHEDFEKHYGKPGRIPEDVA
jgi:hypothetical protein